MLLPLGDGHCAPSRCGKLLQSERYRLYLSHIGTEVRLSSRYFCTVGCERSLLNLTSVRDLIGWSRDRPSYLWGIAHAALWI